MKDDDQSEHSDTGAEGIGNVDSSGAKGIGDVGFVIDGIDLRSADSDELKSLLVDADDLEPLFDPFNNNYPSDEDSHRLSSDGKIRDSGKENGRLPPLWPADLIPPDKLPQASSGISRNSKRRGSTYQHELIKEYKARANSSRIRINSNRSMAFPQLKFAGVKYSGTVTMSQIAMIVMLSARNEALLVRSKEIGCEHLLLGLIENHGFAAGQLLLALHLNGIGRPWALGNFLAKAKTALKKHSVIGGDPDTPDFSQREQMLNMSGAAPDMVFTAEAENALIEAMHLAAQAGYPEVSTKHMLTALIGADSECVENMLRDLSITESEIRGALEICPEIDDSREFVSYFLCSIVHSVIRFRLFQGPVRKYKPFAVKKPKTGKKKKS
jgi:hypothetical protein